MTRQATLRTRRLSLVPLAEEHLDYEVELDSDPEVMRYLGNGAARTRAEVQRYHRNRLAAAGIVPGLGFWAGFSGGQFVGWWILEPPERADQGPVEGQAELGYRLLRRYWRQGLASEGARELLRHGFIDLGLRRIFAETMAVNEASRATMASIGLQYVRTFHADSEDPIPGAEHGEVEYAITREEWLARTSCRTCELVRRRDEGAAPAWDSILRTGGWDLVHAYDTSLAGWIVLVLRRHAISVAALTEAEAIELGRLVRATSEALEHVTGCLKTYVVQFAEHPLHPHVHVHVIPRPADLTAADIGPGIFARLGVPEAERVSQRQMNQIAEALREHEALAVLSQPAEYQDRAEY
jgi:RimJ/RimL family protein N-acetyltransferase/diadenosine tetraphosphate (Ap4A) HIT family hydrolase